jgi:hypothetical protein
MGWEDQILASKSLSGKRAWEKGLFPFILGLASLLVFGYGVIISRPQAMTIGLEGFLLGLFLGQVGVYLYARSQTQPVYKKFFYYYILFAVFAALFILAALSKYLPFGYFAGLGVTLCFGISLLVLLEDSTPQEKKAEQKGQQ